jgi:hypothetical protein
LVALVRHREPPFEIVGRGARARRLIEGLTREIPDLPMRVVQDAENVWVALVGEPVEVARMLSDPLRLVRPQG